jgi:hypothetical protein
MRNRLTSSGSLINRLDESSSPASQLELPFGLCRHLLVPIMATNMDRSTAMIGLRLGKFMRARVTLLQVWSAPPQRSLHWLDAIEQLHDGLSSRSRCSREAEHENSMLEAQMRMVEWLKREVPEPLRNQVEICVEARFGDLPREVARFADRMAVDLLILRRVTSRWGRPVLPRAARRLLRMTDTPAILVHPDAQWPPPLTMPGG